MKVILSSKVFGDIEATKKLKMVLDKKFCELKVLLIATPCLPYGPEKYMGELVNNGVKNENIIVFNHENSMNYANLDIDVVYVTGGNTFTGLKLLKESGFDSEIIKYLNNGVTYIGRSAGSHIASKNVEHVLEFDTNDIGLIDFNAIGLFDGILVCHYDSNRKICYDNLVNDNKYNVYKLTNQEIMIIENDKYCLM